MIFPSTYFPNILIMGSAVYSGKLSIQTNENYQKRSLRNSCNILTANGVINLAIPLKAGKNNHSPIKSVLISYDTPWKKLHKRTIETAYKRSAFYEHYKDVIENALSYQTEFLFDFNYQILLLFRKTLKLPFEISYSERFDNDYLKMVNKFADKTISSELCQICTSYPQVFEYKFGFTPCLSIIDLLFCLGPQAGDYLYDLGGKIHKKLQLF